MFGSGVIDTAIGLIFVFLLVSMLVTIANELIAAVLYSRAKWLRIGIVRLLGSEWAQKLYEHPLIEGSAVRGGSGGQSQRWWSAFRGNGPSYIPAASFTAVLLGVLSEGETTLPEIRRALQSVADGAAAPSTRLEDLRLELLAAAAAARLPQGLAQALQDDMKRLLAPAPPLSPTAGGDETLVYTVGDARADLQRFIDGMPRRYLHELIDRVPVDRVRRTLLVLLHDAEGDIDAFKQNVSDWFNNAMDRVGGWYKRRAQWVTAGLGLLVAVAVNVDAVLVVRHLETHPGERDALVAQARAYAERPAPAPAASAPAADITPELQRFAAVQSRLEHLALPIGWVRAAAQGPGGAAAPRTGLAPDESETRYFLVWPRSWEALADTVAFHAIGWLITALAATLGAPFWFDTLNRFISIRSAGKAPEENDKPPRDPPPAAKQP
jgi:hypothetical protein